MSEYWVSQAKKFCEFCKCWIADNKPSRDFHEKGKKHQDNVKKKIDQVRKKSMKDAKKEEEMVDSIREMNENALKAFKKDLLQNPSLRAQYGIDLKPKESKNEPVYGPMPQPETSKEATQSEEPEVSEKENTSDEEEEGEEEEVEEPGTWHMAASDKGYPYYWNDATSEVTWVAPVGYLKQQGIPREEYDKYRPEEEDKKPKTKKKKKSVPANSTPPPVGPETGETGETETGEPEAKKPKLETIENTTPEEIPSVSVLPEDIPLPPDPSDETTDEVKEEQKEGADDEKEEEEENKSHESEKAPKSHDSYGTWEQVQVIEKPPQIDLGLPTVAKPEQTVIIPANEPKIKFREKTVSSLGSGPVFFKKPKKKMTAAQFLKKREDS